MNESRLLQVGSVIFGYYQGRINSKYTIDRVTPKFAFSGNVKFRRELMGDYVEIPAAGAWSQSHYEIYSEERELEYRKVQMISSIKRFDFKRIDNWPFEKIQELYIMLRTVTNESERVS